MMRRTSLFLLLAGCASAPPTSTATATATATSTPTATSTSTSTSTSTPTPTPTSTPTPTANPVPTGGSVLVGDINAPKGFDPKPVIVSMSDKLVDCYNQARAGNPSLHGKVTLQIVVNEAGAVLSVDADRSGNAYDPTLVQCVDGAMKAGAHFPKPGGTATVAAPLVFRP